MPRRGGKKKTPHNNRKLNSPMNCERLRSFNLAQEKEKKIKVPTEKRSLLVGGGKVKSRIQEVSLIKSGVPNPLAWRGREPKRGSSAVERFTKERQRGCPAENTTSRLAQRVLRGGTSFTGSTRKMCNLMGQFPPAGKGRERKGDLKVDFFCSSKKRRKGFRRDKQAGAFNSASFLVSEKRGKKRFGGRETGQRRGWFGTDESASVLRIGSNKDTSSQKELFGG